MTPYRAVIIDPQLEGPVGRGMRVKELHDLLTRMMDEHPDRAEMPIHVWADDPLGMLNLTVNGPLNRMMPHVDTGCLHLNFTVTTA